MGIDVHLQDEQGGTVEAILDPSSLMRQLLVGAAELGATCLPFVDPYGDTTFNRLQMGALIQELEAAIEAAEIPEVASHGTAVLRLARSCQDNVHLYLKFIGE